MSTPIVTLTCPKCGGKLEITPDIDRFACLYCGTEHIVRRGKGVISLSPVVEAIRQVQAGTDRTASELAIVRLEQEIADLRKNLQSNEERLKEYNANNAGCSPTFTALAGIIAIGSLCLFLSIVSSPSDRSGLLPIGIVFVLSAIMTFFSYKSRHPAERKDPGFTQAIADCQKVIDRKQAELAHHRKIVSDIPNR